MSEFVYFAQEQSPEGYVKIGYTSIAPEDRVPRMQQGNPRRIVLLGSMLGNRRQERVLHEQFAEHHVAGEWFKPAPDLMAFIAAAIQIGLEQEDEAKRKAAGLLHIPYTAR